MYFPSLRPFIFPLLAAVFFPAVARAQNRAPGFEIEHFSIEQGLSNRDLNKIAIDQKGFVWVSSRSGLSRFDGVNFKNYGPDELKIKELDGRVAHFHLDFSSKIWVYTRTEINHTKILDPETDKIHDFDAYFAGKCPFRAEEIHDFLTDPKSGPAFFALLKSNRMFRFDGQFREIKVPDGCNLLNHNFNYSGLSDNRLAAC